MTDITPMPVPAPGVQLAQAYQTPPLAPRRPTDAPPAMPAPQTSEPLPAGPATGVFDKPTPPSMPSPEPRTPAQAFYERRLAEEQDPETQRFLKDRIAPLEAERARKEAITMKQYDSDRALYNQGMEAWTTSQRSLPQTQEDLKQKRYATQKQQEEDAQRAQFGNLPPAVHEYLSESKKTALGAVNALEGVRNAKEVVDAGTLFGIAAPAKLAYYQLRAEAGDKEAARIVAATQTYKTALGPVAAQAIKAYGGTQISNEDRRQGMAMAGADVSLDEKTARRMLDIAERSAIAKINEHRGDLDTMLQNQPAMLRRLYDVPDPLTGMPSAKRTDFPSMEEAQKANLPVGSRFTINGKKFKVQ